MFLIYLLLPKKKKLKKIQHNNPPQTLDSDLGVGSPQHSGLVVD
jgi:hypothetical protein